MVSVTLYKKEEFSEYLFSEFKAGKTADDIISDSYKEIGDYFKTEDKDVWMVIEYRGVPEKILEHLNVFTVKYVHKYFLQIIIPHEAGMELPEKVIESIKSFNMGENTEDFILNMKYDRTLKSDQVAFRMICPKYTYADML